LRAGSHAIAKAYKHTQVQSFKLPRRSVSSLPCLLLSSSDSLNSVLKLTMRFTTLTIASALAAVASAVTACSTSVQAYESITSFAKANSCVPDGYFQAQDLGQNTAYGPTTQSTLIETCEAQCTSYGSKCVAYVGELQKAADSNLYTGQCFYYSSTPSGPVTCANHPTIILAEHKDNSLPCLKSSASASQATAFCSSYLAFGTVTSYTKTVTPTS
jgi:hypothetical protein